MRIGQAVIGDSQDAIIHGVERHFSTRDRLAARVLDLHGDLDRLSRQIICRCRSDGDRQLAPRVFHRKLAIAHPIFGFLNVARAIIRAAHKRHRNKDVRGITRLDGNMNGGSVAFEPGRE